MTNLDIYASRAGRRSIGRGVTTYGEERERESQRVRESEREGEGKGEMFAKSAFAIANFFNLWVQ